MKTSFSKKISDNIQQIHSRQTREGLSLTPLHNCNCHVHIPTHLVSTYPNIFSTSQMPTTVNSHLLMLHTYSANLSVSLILIHFVLLNVYVLSFMLQVLQRYIKSAWGKQLHSTHLSNAWPLVFCTWIFCIHSYITFVTLFMLYLKTRQLVINQIVVYLCLRIV